MNARQVASLSRRHLLKIACALAPAAIGLRLFAPPPDVVEARVRSTSTGPTPGSSPAATPLGGSAGPVAWAFGVNASACIGCGHCVEACKLENHVAPEPKYNRTWVERHVVADDGRVFVDSPDAGIHGFPPESTAPGAAGVNVATSQFVARLCMQCDNPPCVSVCPVSATYRTPEGIVLVDQSRCIGCGYCVVACPYGARYLTPAGEASPTGNPGVADKCTWCYHRISRGQEPACVEVCPVDARVFGDLNDPASPIQAIVSAPGVALLRPELGTRPKVFYVGLEREVS
ncbi:MAG TPA: 4Fe-4S dicluster domain-containing protein [Candidatus Limnocylindrales bacterium]|nr:4Fe-4S dicluster domain-containing protein [Candidatus Limnocylindrales bacterium]